MILIICIKCILNIFYLEIPSMVEINVTMVKRRSAVLYVSIPASPGEGSTKAMVLSYSAEGKTTKKELSHVPGKKKVEIIHLIPYTKYELNVTVKNEYFESAGQKTKFTTKEACKLRLTDILFITYISQKIIEYN